MKPNKHLVVFAKEPRIGKVKSRLATDIGSVSAWAFYQQNLTQILRKLETSQHWRCWIAITPDRALLIPRILSKKWSQIGQRNGGLGQRMRRVMKIMPPGPVVIIGTDIPEISPRHIMKAFKALGRNDVVFGPADDGGYWLVGLKRRPKLINLFQNVRWSTEHALSDTQSNIPSGQKIALLETLEDIDDGASYSRWKIAKTIM